MVEHWNSDGGTVEQCWWNSETVIVEQWNSDRETVSWNSGTVMMEQCGQRVWWNSVVEQWKSVVEQWNSDKGTVKH